MKPQKIGSPNLLKFAISVLGCLLGLVLWSSVRAELIKARPSPLPINIGQADEFHRTLLSYPDCGLQLPFVDVLIPSGKLSLSVERTYRNKGVYVGVLGKGWSSNLDVKLILSPDNEMLQVQEDDGRLTRYTRRTNGQYHAIKGAFDGSWIESRSGNTFQRIGTNGYREIFDALGRLIERKLESSVVTYSYQNTGSPYPTQIANETGQYLQLDFQDGRLMSVSDPLGRKVAYTYQGDRLVKVQDSIGRETFFHYDRGWLSRLVLPNRSGITIHYFQDGSLQKISGPGAQQTHFEKSIHGTTGQFRLTMTSGNGSVETLDIVPTGLTESTIPDLDAGRLADQGRGGIAMTRTRYDGSEVKSMVMKNMVAIHDSRYQAAPVYIKGGDAVESASTPEDQDRPLTSRDWRAEAFPTMFAERESWIQYDAVNRPVRFEVQGEVETWTWDDADRLVAWQLAGGDVTRYRYNGHNQLLQTWLGANEQVAFEYDDAGRLIMARSAAGQSWQLAYNHVGQLVGMKDETSGELLRYRYDRNGRLIGVGASGQKEVRFEYDEHGREKKATGGYGWVREKQFDEAGRQVSVANEYGEKVEFKWGEGDELKWTTLPDGSRVEVQQDDIQSQYTITLSNEDTIQRTFDAEGQLVEIVDANGHQTIFSHDANGNLTAVNGPDGKSINYTYNARGQLLSESASWGTSRHYTYDARGRLATLVEGSVTSTFNYSDDGYSVRLVNQDRWEESHYDAEDRLIRQSSPSGTIDYTYTARGDLLAMIYPGGGRRYEYNDAGRVIAETRIEGEESFSKGYRYNQQGFISQIDHHDGTNQKYEYDDKGRVVRHVNQLGQTYAYTFDDAGNVVAEAGPFGEYRLRYDAQGRMIEESDPIIGTRTIAYPSDYEMVVTAPGNQVTRITIDADSRPVKVVDPMGGVIQKQYDADGFLTTFIDPLKHRYTGTFDYDTQTLTWRTPGDKAFKTTFNAQGQPTVFAYPDGRQVRYTYNVDGDVTSIHSGNEAVWTYTYDAQRRLIGASGKPGVSTYQYDHADRLVEYRDPFQHVVKIGRDRETQSEWIQAPSGSTFQYQFAAADVLTSIHAFGETIQYEYDAVNRIAAKTYPQGITVKYEYAAGYDLKSITVRKGNSIRYREIYSRDAAGNLTQIKDLSGTHGFQYDPLNRLVSAQYANGYGQEFKYDRAGNIIRSAAIPEWQYSVDQELIRHGAANLVYDAAGRLKGWEGGVQFEYDERDLVTKVTLPDEKTIHYAYDAQGRLIERVAGEQTLRYVYHGDQLIETVNPDGSFRLSYVPDIEIGQWAVVHYNDKNYYPVWSSNQTLLALVDQTGVVANTYRYDAWGNVLEIEGDIPVPPFYAGSPVDVEVQIIKFGARLYSPLLKRFLTPDPAGPDRDGNFYAYALDNPLRFTDRQGTAADERLPLRLQEIAQADPHVRDQIFRHLENTASLERSKDPMKRAAGRIGRQSLETLNKPGNHLVVVKNALQAAGRVDYERPTTAIVDEFGSKINFPKNKWKAPAMTAVHEATHVYQISKQADKSIDALEALNRAKGFPMELQSHIRQHIVEHAYAGEKFDIKNLVKELITEYPDTYNQSKVSSKEMVAIIRKEAPHLDYDDVLKEVQKGRRNGVRAIRNIPPSAAADVGFHSRVARQTPQASRGARWADRARNVAQRSRAALSRAKDIAKIGLHVGAKVLGRVALHLTPVGYIIDIQDAMKLGAWLGTTAADAYIAFERSRRAFFDALNIFGDEDEDEQARRRRRLEELAYPEGVANISLMGSAVTGGGFPSGGGGSVVALHTPSDASTHLNRPADSISTDSNTSNSNTSTGNPTTDTSSHNTDTDTIAANTAADADNTTATDTSSPTDADSNISTSSTAGSNTSSTNNNMTDADTNTSGNNPTDRSNTASNTSSSASTTPRASAAAAAGGSNSGFQPRGNTPRPARPRRTGSNAMGYIFSDDAFRVRDSAGDRDYGPSTASGTGSGGSSNTGGSSAAHSDPSEPSEASDVPKGHIGIIGALEKLRKIHSGDGEEPEDWDPPDPGVNDGVEDGDAEDPDEFGPGLPPPTDLTDPADLEHPQPPQEPDTDDWAGDGENDSESTSSDATSTSSDTASTSSEATSTSADSSSSGDNNSSASSTSSGDSSDNVPDKVKEKVEKKEPGVVDRAMDAIGEWLHDKFHGDKQDQTPAEDSNVSGGGVFDILGEKIENIFKGSSP